MSAKLPSHREELYAVKLFAPEAKRGESATFSGGTPPALVGSMTTAIETAVEQLRAGGIACEDGYGPDGSEYRAYDPKRGHSGYVYLVEVTGGKAPVECKYEGKVSGRFATDCREAVGQ